MPKAHPKTQTIQQFERDAAEAEASIWEACELLGVDYFTGRPGAEA